MELFKSTKYGRITIYKMFFMSVNPMEIFEKIKKIDLPYLRKNYERFSSPDFDYYSNSEPEPVMFTLPFICYVVKSEIIKEESKNLEINKDLDELYNINKELLSVFNNIKETN